MWQKNINENIDYIIKQIEINLNNINILEKELYFEMSKNQIVDCFKKISITVKKWKQYIDNKDLNSIKKEYKDIESEASELELCLVEYDNIFHCEGISYSLHEIGKSLIEILNNKEVD